MDQTAKFLLTVKLEGLKFESRCLYAGLLAASKAETQLMDYHGWDDQGSAWWFISRDEERKPLALRLGSCPERLVIHNVHLYGVRRMVSCRFLPNGKH
ncbi:hypothetical protein RRG08_021935 [Elysia crispata]|uniref:Uncharacterized protein n=1 Tax=Elysia crispata TaxID=231223 RepID=A0AAE1ABZ9_9GAST|nr:hypothetical protein RRG08_021935 [Elysia crispata]